MHFEFESISPVTAALTLAAIILATVFLAARLHGILCFGPGPWGLPLLGFYPFLRKDFHVQLADLTKKYGDTYLLSLCGKLYLHLGSHTSLREAFVKNADCFLNRTNEMSVISHMFKDGLSFREGETWRVWRKFLGQSMRELGLGPREQLHGPMLNSLQSIIDALKESNGQPVDISELLIFQSTEVVRRLVLGEKVAKETALEFNRLFLMGNLLVGEKEMLLCGSLAKYLILNWTANFKVMLKAREELDLLLYTILENHRLDFDPKHTRDFVDLYLREKYNRETKNDPQAKHFTDETFVGTVSQVFGDSGYSIGAFIASYLKELAQRPDVQNAIYEEIAQEIGTERLPTYEDKERMPYTNSAMKEIERTSNVFPSFPTFVCNSDTTVSGVFVPKGTISYVNSYAIHNDPEVYKTPEKFDPKRFMSNNEIETTVPENPAIFGVGKRSCSGEPLVRFEMFMFVTTILQNFILHVDDTLAEDNKTTDFTKILGYRFIAIPRKDHLSSF